MKRELKEELKYKLSILEASIILDFKFDIQRNRITLFIKTVNGKITYSEIIINKVSAFTFMNATERQRKQFCEYELDDVLELSDIGLIEEEIQISPISEVDIKFYGQFKSGANLYIEIYSKSLFIEAGEIIINSKIYNLEE